jgi:alkylation response protein AidB-like acyl-CoA dehydrogenase
LTLEDRAASLDTTLRDSAASFLRERPDRARLRGSIGRSRPFDRALWLECASLGWTGMLLPEALGGLELGWPDALVICEEAGRHLLAEPLALAAVLPALLLGACDVDPGSELAARLSEWLTTGERVLSVAWQERANQMEGFMPICEIVDGRLSGRKFFVAGCETDSIVLVWAASRGEPALVAVDAQAAGVTRVLQPSGLGTQADLVFEAAEILEGGVLLIGDAAQRALCAALAGTRLALAAELSGLASGCLALTLNHVRARQQFERTLGSFQTVQHRCVDSYIEVELAAASCGHAAALLEASGGDLLSDEADAAICAAKARAGEAAVRVAREAVQLHGAMGFCDDVDAGLFLRSALYVNAALGGPVALRRRFRARLPYA